MEATKNRVIFASGTAFPNYTTPTGETHVPGQGNNMYIFPGLGLGAVLAQPKQISSKMIYSASKALADALTTEELDQHWLYPSLTRIREVSREVAVAVIEESIREDLCQDETIKTMSRQSLLDHVSKQMWHPTEDLNASI